MRAIFPILSVLLASCALAQDAPRARNAILFIGDGVDDHQLTLGRNYLHGAGGALVFEELPRRATARVLTVREDDPSRPEYVADSASGGTALSAGVVTSRGRIATTAGDDEDVPTLIELAKAAGRKVGVVATSRITDATPASFYAHVAVRFCEGPEDMDGSGSSTAPDFECPGDDAARGGAGSIAEQLARSGVDVALGGGLDVFGQSTHDGQTVLELAAENGFAIVRSRTELEAHDDGRLLGLFTDGHLPVIWQGEGRRRARPIEIVDDAIVEPGSFGCEPAPSFGDTPTLGLLTAKAIELLSRGDEGFFLVVESASIDKRAHAADPCGQIGEIRQLEDAVSAALEYAQGDPSTLILVTSDHGHAAQIVPYPSLFQGTAARLGRLMHTPGKLALLDTPEGGRMAVSYATNENFLEEHTGTAVPVFASGPGSEEVGGMIDQADVFEIVRSALGL